MHHNRIRSLATAILGIWVVLSTSGVQAELRLEFPGETFGPPFYARLEIPTIDPVLIPSNGEWAALVLYRQRSCIPGNFNLLELFDAPAAFNCPLGGLSGYEVWTNAPGVDPAPRYTRLSGTGNVSIWFVRLDDFEQAAADGRVTIVDFEQMPSLRRGTASFYDELLRPSQSNASVLIHINAHGTTDDGGGFRLTYTVTGNPFEGTRVRSRIAFPAAAHLPDAEPLTIPFTGHWYDPNLPGDGLGLHPVRGTDQMFGTWFTVNSIRERIWYALDSTNFDGLRADFQVLLSEGPDPEAPNGVALETVGEFQIEFLTCTTAVAKYTVGASSGQQFLESLVPGDDCSD